MNKQKVFQLSLTILLIFFCIVFYLKYFSQNEKISKNKIDETIENEKKIEINVGNESENTIEQLKYVSEDLFGNTYIITANSASFKKDEKDQLELYEVNAKIIQDNNDVIYIYSGVADYNRVNNNTIFKEKVNIKYKDHELDSNVVKLDFSKNLIEIKENVYYINKTTKIYADKAEINLLDKKMKISMYNEKEKVKITGKY